MIDGRTCVALVSPLPLQVKEIALKMGAHDGNPDHEFPQLAGSHLSSVELGTPALAFVRAVCHFFMLDSAVTEQATVMRRQLLRMIHCKEFGPEALYKDPCMTLILPDLICTTCQDCQDVDLCRDPKVCCSLFEFIFGGRFKNNENTQLHFQTLYI